MPVATQDVALVQKIQENPHGFQTSRVVGGFNTRCHYRSTRRFGPGYQPEGVLRSVDLVIDGIDLAIIGATSGRHFVTPLPEKEAGDQSMPKITTTTAAPSDGGDVVGESLAHRSWGWN